MSDLSEQLDVAIELGRQLDRHLAILKALSRFNDFGEPGDPAKLLYNVIALSEEVGEVAGAVKKGLRVGNPFDRHAAIMDELGDVLYYWTRIVMQLGVPFEAVIALHYRKLERRRAEGAAVTGS